MPLHLPPTLIESWLPFAAIGAESQREHSTGLHPAPNRLHVWWARRPLVVSAAAVLASLLPQWSSDWPPRLRDKFPAAEAYQAWFLRLLGILGDPVAGRKLLAHARQVEKSIPNPYDYDRAFTHNPPAEELETMLDLLKHTWGTRDITVMDPMAGGGSIPFEALRYGFNVLAGELNPVASVILKATLDYPARFGAALASDIRRWGQRWYELVKPRLESYFTPLPSGAEGAAYLWARTVACPTTGKPVPLSPNWWLSTGSNPVAVRVRTDPAWAEPRFDIVRGRAIDFDPDDGTVSRGVGRSPWTGDPIDGEYIKREAQAGRMGQMLYAVAVKRPGGFDFRPPTEQDLAAVRRAEAALAENLPRWEVAGLVPSEVIPEGLKTGEPRRYGMYRWVDMFSPRQLLSLLTFLETLRELSAEMRQEMDEGQAGAVETYLAFAISKCTNYNSRLSVWHPARTSMANTFNRHDFAFAWSHGEFDAAQNLLPWALNQELDSYKELANLTRSAQLPLRSAEQTSPSAQVEAGKPAPRLRIWQGNAADLSHVPSGFVHHVCVDPPYYANVMYAELSDFFYVWLKRSVGHLYPDFFCDALTNKDDEAVANQARFRALTPGPRAASPKRSGGDSPAGRRGETGTAELARHDYERKMAACFREMQRVLRDDGVLTVMFTHKEVEAWDTLATALIGAGFAIKASWPVHTESEHSLHQAQKNAAASTILLVCRKRHLTPHPPLPDQGEGVSQAVWWDDLKGRVRQVAREKAAEFAEQGVSGVDLYISTFGPVLAVISEHWPVLTSQVDEKTGQPVPLRPEMALDLAREEVIALRKRGLLLGREIQFDPLTDWYLMAWDAFKAEEFPADEARKLAIALGLDIEEDLVRRKRVITKKGSFVLLQQPKQRRRKGLADPEAMVFDTWLDAAHAALLIYEEDGAAACEAFLKRAGLRTDATFKACLQAMLNAVPRTRIKGDFARPEAKVLDDMRAALFEELVVPAEESQAPEKLTQIGLFDGHEGTRPSPGRR